MATGRAVSAARDDGFIPRPDFHADISTDASAATDAISRRRTAGNFHRDSTHMSRNPRAPSAVNYPTHPSVIVILNATENYNVCSQLCIVPRIGLL